MKKIRDCYDFYGYKVYTSGKVCTKNGHEITSFNKGTILLTINGAMRHFNLLHLIYGLATKGEYLPSPGIVCYPLDGDYHNASFENIAVCTRKEYFQKFPQKQAQAVVLNPEIMKEIRKRDKKRTTSQRQFSQECANEYGCCISTINRFFGASTTTMTQRRSARPRTATPKRRTPDNQNEVGIDPDLIFLMKFVNFSTSVLLL